ncbi:MAG: lipid A biosynthesis lauroyl acyltransferase [Gammaproteobacteria bacterium HGW-Gammaproteobacteria-2]|jgi:KDO2-lipid IV(A) lauroyltransferase|nr:MAG: lipid A biosynthesis lauroyl acyltransferase [Gammaproteobacteria bacterium HGW-Gammaproteobacteria-2]
MLSNRHAANLLYALSWLLGRLPFVVLHAIGATLGQCVYWLGGREARVTRRNLELVQPGISPRQRDALAAAVLRAVGRNSLHTLRFWTRPDASNRALIAQVHGEALLHAALARGRGLIIAAPHYGNWELLNQFLASCAPITLVYRPPESAIAEQYLLRVRGRRGVTQVPARSSGVRALLRTLHAGGMVGILPDQRPKSGEGAFAPLFGIQTLTMTLLTRLAQRTGASVLFAIAERRPGWDAGYDVHFFPADAAIGGSDDTAALAALNAGIAAIAQRDPLQYQWNYKRFNARPPGSDETNPYLRR